MSHLTLEIDDARIATSGQLNFLLTKLVVRYLACHDYRYASMNDIVGALECAKREFQRRVVDPYERVKVESNLANFSLGEHDPCDPYSKPKKN